LQEGSCCGNVWQIELGKAGPLDLARISHQLSTAVPDPGMSAALRSVGFLDVLSSTRTVEYACGILGRALLAKRRIPARPRYLATKPGEKCGLVDQTGQHLFGEAPKVLQSSETIGGIDVSMEVNREL